LLLAFLQHSSLSTGNFRRRERAKPSPRQTGGPLLIELFVEHTSLVLKIHFNSILFAVRWLGSGKGGDKKME
jgi:hypothetical protein